MLEFHAIGLARVLELLHQAGVAGQAIRDSLARDGLVSSMLTLHGLHPFDLGTRLKRVLEQLRPLFEVHGCTATIENVERGTVLITLAGPSANGRPAAFVVKQALEAAIFEAAPEVFRIEFAEPESISPRVSLPIIPIPE